MKCAKCGNQMSQNVGGWWTCWGCGNTQPPGYVAVDEACRVGGRRERDLRAGATAHRELAVAGTGVATNSPIAPPDRGR